MKYDNIYDKAFELKAKKLGMGGMLKLVFNEIILKDGNNSIRSDEDYYKDLLYGFLYEELKEIEVAENI